MTIKGLWQACLFVVLVQTLGCAQPGKLTDGGKEVKIIPDKPGTNCEVVGKVEGDNEFGSEDVAKNDARNKAAKLGGNYLKITDQVRNGKIWKIHGLAYECH